MTTTDDARLVEIEAREQAATPGPWEVDARARTRITSANDRGVATAGGYTTNTDGGAHHDQNEANAEFIANAREDVRYLLDRLKAANERRYVVRENGEVHQLSCEHCDAAESRIRELEEAVANGANHARLALGRIDDIAQFTDEQMKRYTVGNALRMIRLEVQRAALALHSDEVQEEGNGGGPRSRMRRCAAVG